MKNKLNICWLETVKKLEDHFDRSLDLQGILFLIGLQEVGLSHDVLSKREKLEVIHVAVCAILSQWGYYELQGRDKDGWPHWEKTSSLPFMGLLDEENLIKEGIINYFDQY